LDIAVKSNLMRVYELQQPNGLDSWSLAERPIPKPERDQVLVKIRAVSLNSRDILIATGRYGSAPLPAALIPLSDGAGEVVEVGSDVSRFTTGARVAGIFSQSWLGGSQVDDAWNTALGGAVHGVLAEYKVFDQNGLVRIPNHLSYEEGSTLPCAGVTAWNAFYGLKALQPGQTVLTLGTGGVSVFAIQFAHAAGARVLATSSSDNKLAKVRSLGASETINYNTNPQWDNEVRRLTQGRGVDHVIDIGGAGTLPRSIASARAGSVISLIGMLAGGTQIDPLAILGSSCIVRGVLVGSREMFEAMLRAIEWHRIRPVIDRTFDFEHATDALKYLDKGVHVGKVVIRVS
jgi:NADPH:quinone reductase-like Zn-dependent oxidoreductase